MRLHNHPYVCIYIANIVESLSRTPARSSACTRSVIVCIYIVFELEFLGHGSNEAVANFVKIFGKVTFHNFFCLTFDSFFFFFWYVLAKTISVTNCIVIKYNIHVQLCLYKTFLRFWFLTPISPVWEVLNIMQIYCISMIIYYSN